jgi:hypothetical protein
LEINPEQFAKIVEGIKRASEDGKTPDKRRAQRIEQRSSAVITFVDAAPMKTANNSITVTVRDYSTRGIGILVHEGFPKGTQFIMQMRRQDEPPVSILCTTAHCRMINAHLYAVGAEFTCILPGKTENRSDDASEQQRISASILD